LGSNQVSGNDDCPGLDQGAALRRRPLQQRPNPGQDRYAVRACVEQLDLECLHRYPRAELNN